jgi:hypothetical protein
MHASAELALYRLSTPTGNSQLARASFRTRAGVSRRGEPIWRRGAVAPRPRRSAHTHCTRARPQRRQLTPAAASPVLATARRSVAFFCTGFSRAQRYGRRVVLVEVAVVDAIYLLILAALYLVTHGLVWALSRLGRPS